jgi:hypothetical protein
MTNDQKNSEVMLTTLLLIFSIIKVFHWYEMNTSCVTNTLFIIILHFKLTKMFNY